MSRASLHFRGSIFKENDKCKSTSVKDVDDFLEEIHNKKKTPEQHLHFDQFPSPHVLSAYGRVFATSVEGRSGVKFGMILYTCGYEEVAAEYLSTLGIDVDPGIAHIILVAHGIFAQTGMGRDCLPASYTLHRAITALGGKCRIESGYLIDHETESAYEHLWVSVSTPSGDKIVDISHDGPEHFGAEVKPRGLRGWFCKKTPPVDYARHKGDNAQSSLRESLKVLNSVGLVEFYGTPICAHTQRLIGADALVMLEVQKTIKRRKGDGDDASSFFLYKPVISMAALATLCNFAAWMAGGEIPKEKKKFDIVISGGGKRGGKESRSCGMSREFLSLI